MSMWQLHFLASKRHLTQLDLLLLKKLGFTGFDKKSIQTLTAFTKKSIQKVLVNNNASDPIEPHKNIPQ